MKVRTVPAPPEAPKSSPLECVELTPKEGHPVVMCFDARTHLRSFQAGRQASPQGEVPYSARQSEWKAIEGVMVPTVEELTTGPTSMELRLTELTFDGKLAPDLFRMPKAGAAKPAKAAKPEKTPKPAKPETPPKDEAAPAGK